MTATTPQPTAPVANVPLTIDLGDGNPSLAGLRGRAYTSAFTEVPNRNLPRTLLHPLQVVYKALRGDHIDLDGHTIAVKATRGAFDRLYRPSVFQAAADDGTLTAVIKWGNEIIPLTVANRKLTPAGSEINPTVLAELGTSLEMELIFETVTTQRGPDVCLRFALFSDSYPNGIIMHFPCRTINVEEGQPPLTHEILNSTIRRGIADVAVLLQRAPEGSSLQGETVNLTDLETGVYKITAYRFANTQYGKKAIVQVVPPTLGPDGLQVPEDAEFSITSLQEPVQVWLNSTLNPIFVNGDPVVTPELPARLYLHAIKTNRANKLTASAGIILGQQAPTEGEDALDLNF